MYTRIKHCWERQILLTSILNDNKEKLSRLINKHSHWDLEASTYQADTVPSVPVHAEKSLVLFIQWPLMPHALFNLCSPFQVVLAVDLMPVEMDGKREGRSRVMPRRANPQLLRKLVPAASATCRDTPESPVPSGDGSIETLCSYRSLWLESVKSDLIFQICKSSDCKYLLTNGTKTVSFL